jgi:cell wall-associated NlpC family hydrolase
MRTTTTRTTRSRFARILAAALIVVPTALATLPTVSTAAPSEEQVQAARARLQTLNHDLETAIEAWNDARSHLQQTRGRLAEAKQMMEEAEAEAAAAREQLSDRAVDAYTGFGSQLDVLLGADDFNEFSDRLEFLGAIAESDADLAAQADGAAQRSEWAAEEFAAASAEAEDRVSSLAGRRAEIERMFDEQEAIYEELSSEWREYQEAQEILAAQREALEQATQEETTVPSNPAPSNPAPSNPAPSNPPPVSGAAGVAVQAAYSVLGTRYVFGSSNPAVGLDCSGVTSYAWAQAGVYLPHSAAAQRAALPQVPLSEVQPGDIIYYGNFGPHVAIYVGGGQIIHATSPAPGGQTRLDSLYGYDRPWSAHRVAG